MGCGKAWGLRAPGREGVHRAQIYSKARTASAALGPPTRPVPASFLPINSAEAFAPRGKRAPLRPQVPPDQQGAVCLFGPFFGPELAVGVAPGGGRWDRCAAQTPADWWESSRGPAPGSGSDPVCRGSSSSPTWTQPRHWVVPGQQNTSWIPRCRSRKCSRLWASEVWGAAELHPPPSECQGPRLQLEKTFGDLSKASSRNRELIQMSSCRNYSRSGASWEGSSSALHAS